MFLRCASSSESVRTIVRSGTVERAPASYASRRIEWVQPQFGSPQCRAARTGGASSLTWCTRQQAPRLFCEWSLAALLSLPASYAPAPAVDLPN